MTPFAQFDVSEVLDEVDDADDPRCSFSRLAALDCLARSDDEGFNDIDGVGIGMVVCMGFADFAMLV